MSNSKIYVATESFTANIDDQQYAVHRDRTRIREGHPLLRKHGTFFKPVEDDVTYEVEQATSAPGERRRRPAKADSSDS